MDFRTWNPDTVNWITLGFMSCWVVFMVTLERFFPYRKGLKIFRDGFWLDFFWYTIAQSYVLKIVIFDYIIAPAKIKLGFAHADYFSGWPLIAIVPVFFVFHDFYIYWFHRFQHESKILWRTHEAHHSVKEVDWLAGSRSHALEILINQTVEFLPIFFLLDVKTALIVVPIKATIDACWGMYIHSNIDVHSGKLQYFINGPEMHQWHHADHREVFYSNYGTKLAIWDWIFGTGFLPGLKPLSYAIFKPTNYGLPYEYPRGFFAQFVFAFKRFNVEKLESIPVVKKHLEFWPSLGRMLTEQNASEESDDRNLA